MAAPNLKEIEWYIDQLEHTDIPDSGYVLLSALYTIRDHMTGQNLPIAQAYSLAPEPVPQQTLDRYGDSDFLRAISGKDADAAWGVMDELMETLRAVNPRVYATVMRKVGAL